MMTKKRKTGKKGFSLVEVTIAASVMAVVLMVAVSFVTSGRRNAKASDERAYAVQKGIALLEEVRNFTQQVGDFGELDSLDDGIVHNNFLTIQNVLTPDHVASGNRSSATSPTGWHYSRRLVVKPFAGLDIRDLRIVSALVYRDDDNGNHTLLADVGTVLRAPGDQAYPTTQTYDVYFMAIENIPGWWVYMSYIKPLMEVTVDDLQARNPGLDFRAHWITKSSYGRDLRYNPFINEEVDSVHDIDWAYFYPGTMPAGSAADEYYVPGQMNARMKTHDDVVANTYKLKSGYDVNLNPLPYSLADEYNHGMRYVDELRYFKMRCEKGLEDETTPTWRILTEKMCTDPGAFENAIIINLHGELLPMPAIRNYSDPARNPSDVNYRGMRAVTHPEWLCTPDSEDLRLRVYAYEDLTDEQWVVADDTLDVMTVVLKGIDLSDNVNGVTLPGNPESLIIERIYGGVDGSRGEGFVDGLLDPYGRDGWLVDPLEPLTAPADPATSEKMWATVIGQDVDSDGRQDTLITLYNTPVNCPLVEALPASPGLFGGLPSHWRLYGLDYIPSSTEAAADFSRDLTSTFDMPKNTARWVITIPDQVYGRADVTTELVDPHDTIDDAPMRLTVETRMGLDLQTGVNWIPGSLPDPIPDILDTAYASPPENCSRTYGWWTDTPEDVPFTERSQFIGDPRHCPYADLKDQLPAGAFNDFQNGYNWWFDNFKDSAYGNAWWAWEGYSQNRMENDESNDADGWSDYHWHIDVPRYMELLRSGLVSTNSVYTTLTGFSYFYMGIGNEIGYDSANGFAKGIPVSRKPFYGTGGSRTEQVMVPWGNPDDAGTIGNGMKLIMRSIPTYTGGGNYWWGKHWIGDLYPDSDWDNGDGTGWLFDGNLPTGNTTSTCIRLKRESINRHLPLGSTMVYSRRCMREEGCNSFMLVGNRSNTFYHNYSSSNGTLTAAGDEIADEYAFPLPTSASISRPFRHDWGGSSSWKSNPDFDFTADYPHNSAAKVRTFYTHPWSAPNGTGSALLGITNPANTNTSFQVINGLSQTIESGSAFIAKWSLLSLVHGFLTAGEDGTLVSAAVRIEQLPRLEIKQPTIITELDDPSTITVHWSSEFLRWDGQKYTGYYPDGFSEIDWIDHLRYVLLYSNDNGDTWCYMESDPNAVPRLATAGKMPTGGDASYLLQDLDPLDDEFFTWAVPSAVFPESSYLIRAECYRDNKALHYSYHMEKIFIDR